MEYLLSLWFVLTCPELQVIQARELSKAGRYEESEAIFNKTTLANRDQYLFWRALNHFKLNHKAEAKKYLERMEDSFANDIPERHRVVAMLMKIDLMQWKQEETDLSDIAREMGKITDRLGASQGGPVTQQRQKDVVDRLSKLIKQQEDALDKQQQSADAGPAKQNQPMRPLDESKIANEGGTGEVERKKMRQLSENWGTLPPRERAAALQELTQGMPARHREAIENYFRRLAEAQSKR